MLPQPLVELFWGYQYVNSFLSHQKFTLHHNLPFLVFYGIFIILYLLFYVYFISALFFYPCGNVVFTQKLYLPLALTAKSLLQ